MLIRFILSNFLSFDEEREFNMLAGALKTHRHHVHHSGKVDVLKAAAIYGANGAGKSNLVKAIKFLKKIVKEGGLIESIDKQKFKLNEANSAKPIKFEIEFTIEKKIYSYGVTLNHFVVEEEWLYETGAGKLGRMIFERKLSKSNTPSIKISKEHQKTKKAKLLIKLLEENILKNNELLLGKTDSLKILEIINVRRWFERNLVVIFPSSKFTLLCHMLTTEKEFKSFTNSLLKTFETGINELDTEIVDLDKLLDEKQKMEFIKKLKENKNNVASSTDGEVFIAQDEGKYVVKKVIAKHEDNKGNAIPFELSEESDGTQRLLDFILPIFSLLVLKDDTTFVIDEIDQSIHPALLCTLIAKVMSDISSKGQIIFTTHESNLLNLEIFRQDEIWFAEKNPKIGSTQLYSLLEFKPRSDLDIRKGYLKGQFGAIPFLANLKDLNWH